MSDEAPPGQLEESGWRDYLVVSPDPARIDDRLLLTMHAGDSKHKQREIRAARDVWHRVLAAYLTRANGATLDSMTGKFGWFELRLTRRETVDLIRSAKAAPKSLITREIPYTAGGAAMPDETVRWIATVDISDPKGASWRDMGAAVPSVLRATGARLGGLISTLGIVGGALGLLISKGSNEALFFVMLGAYGVVLSLAWGVLSHERALTAAAKAWPRLKTYRPERWRFEMMVLRSPGPYGVSALATVGLLLAAYVWLRSAGPWVVSDETACWIALGCAGIVVLAYSVAEFRVSPLRSAWKAEADRRRPPAER